MECVNKSYFRNSINQKAFPFISLTNKLAVLLRLGVLICLLESYRVVL